MNALTRIEYRSLERMDGSGNHTEIFSDGVMYGIDWNTGLSWQRCRGSSPVFYSSFLAFY